MRLDWGNRVARLPDVWYGPSFFFDLNIPVFFASAVSISLLSAPLSSLA